MKHYLLIILLIFILFSCKEKKVEYPVFNYGFTPMELPKIKINHENYDSECVVGKKYTICSELFDKGDPFNPRHTVVINDKMKGYVQYYEYGNKDKITFHRSCEDFIHLVNQCK